MFYLLSFIALAQIHLQHRNEPIAHARRLLLLAMAIQFAKYIAHAFADIDMHLYHGYSYLPNAINVFVEEIVVMLLGMSLIATVRLKRTPRLHAVLLILPIVICMPLRYIFDTVNVSVIAFAYTIIMAVLIIIHVCLLVRRYQDLLNQTFADTTPHAVTWVLTTLALLTLYFIVWLAIVWLGISALYTQPYKYLYIRIFYLLLSIIPWTFYLRRISRVKPINLILLDDDTQPDDTPTAELKAWQQPDFDKAILNYCSNPDVFTRNDLTIIDVANAIGTNRTYVSRWCRQRGANFNSFIRELRLDYARNLLTTPTLPLTQIAQKAGFGSTLLFLTAFT